MFAKYVLMNAPPNSARLRRRSIRECKDEHDVIEERIKRGEFGGRGLPSEASVQDVKKWEVVVM